MTLGQILLCIGYGMAYITMQIIPLIIYIFFMFKKEVRKNNTLDDLLFEPITCMIFLIPLFGATIGCAFTDKEKWLTRLWMISFYIIVIGFIIMVIKI